MQLLQLWSQHLAERFGGGREVDECLGREWVAARLAHQEEDIIRHASEGGDLADLESFHLLDQGIHLVRGGVSVQPSSVTLTDSPTGISISAKKKVDDPCFNPFTPDWA